MPKPHSPVPSPPAKKKILSILAKTLEKQKLNFSHSALFHAEAMAGPNYPAGGRWHRAIAQ